MLLAIDTSGGTSVAVVDRDRGLLAQHDSADTRRHAEVIGDLIVACLDDSGIEVAELSGVVAGMGPGPFTGLRVGIAAARTFAWGARKPVIPIASHDAIAFGEDSPVLIATDARRREFYWSAYSGSDDAGLPVRVSAPALVKIDELSGVTGFEGYRVIEGAAVSAGSLGLLAELMFAHGRPFAADEPLYLRSPDVTISSGPKRVTA